MDNSRIISSESNSNIHCTKYSSKGTNLFLKRIIHMYKEIEKIISKTIQLKITVKIII